MMRDENYYVINGFMRNRLELKGVALNVFAIIWGFSQDGESEFTGSRQYLCDFTGATPPTVDKALKDLIEQGLLIKKTETRNGVIFNSYKVNLECFSNFTPYKETLYPPIKKLYTPYKETLHNNIIINKEDNKEDIKKEVKKESCFNEFENEEVKNALLDFIAMRKAIKKPLTERALQMIIKKLKTLANGDDKKAVEILNQSIIHSWQDIYELKEDKEKVKTDPSAHFGYERKFSKNDYDKILVDIDKFEL